MDVPFLVYIRQEQQRRPEHHKLNVFQLMAIYHTCFGGDQKVNQQVVDGLIADGILLQSKNGKVSMSKEYSRIVATIGHRDNKNGGVNGDVNGGVNVLSRSLKEVFSIVKSYPGIKIKQIAEIRNRAESTISKQLAELKKKGLIEYRGADKTGGYYVSSLMK